jgi:HSP20 family protein
MNSLLRRREWNPLRELEELQNRLLGDFDRQQGRVTLRQDGDDEALRLSQWSPMVDITEDKNEYLIKADLPEVKREDLHVTVENGVLTVTGERKFEKEEKDKKYHRVERSYGSFTRSFTLPEDADSAKVNAEFKDGVLKVHVAKLEKAKQKAIDVKVE